MGSGQLFLVGHMSLNLFYAVREREPRNNTASVIIFERTTPARKRRESVFTSPAALHTGLQGEISIITLHNHRKYVHACTCSPSTPTPTHNELL